MCSGTSERSERRNRGRCFNCGVRGHIARDCRKPRKEKALLVDTDDEPTLLCSPFGIVAAVYSDARRVLIYLLCAA
ncbi:hypothetical protein E2562_030331, partial [Oryza meyeriana var. granulata]